MTADSGVHGALHDKSRTSRFDSLMGLYRTFSGCLCRWLRVRVSRREGEGISGTGSAKPFTDTSTCSGMHSSGWGGALAQSGGVLQNAIAHSLLSVVGWVAYRR